MTVETGKQASAVVVGGDGSISVAPVGTPEPANISTALNAAFVDTGYAAEGGVTLSDGKTIQGVGAWQSFYDLREIITARDFTVGFALRQWTRGAVGLAFGGGAFIDQGGGKTKYTPPSPSTVDERCLVVAWIDGTKNWRLVVPRCIAVDNVSATISRTAPGDLAISMKVLAPSVGAFPYYFLTDDIALAS
jgi:hypothetical protein